jgi:predicted DNA-binding protein with PD1-like motif
MNNQFPYSNARLYAFRLTPGQDLKQGLLAFALANKIKAGYVATCVGSLTEVSLRFANQPEASLLMGHFEIVSLTGTLSDSACHLHLAVSDSAGKTVGGHLMDGNRIYTTAEIVIGELEGLAFGRALDDTYGYKELEVRPR